MQETGWNTWFTQQVQTHEAQFVATDFTPFIQSIVQGLANEGIVLTSAQVQSIFDAAANAVQQLVNEIISDTATAIESEILSLLANAVDRSRTQIQQSPDTKSLQPESRGFGCAYFGIAAGLFSVGAAAFGAEPIALGFGFAAVVLDIAAYEDFC